MTDSNTTTTKIRHRIRAIERDAAFDAMSQLMTPLYSRIATSTRDVKA